MKCKDKPTPQLPIIGTCPSCGGNGCADCKETGTFELTQCPIEWLEDEIWHMIELAELYEKGLPPVAGGSLDQTAYFIRFARMVMNENAKYKIKE